MKEILRMCWLVPLLIGGGVSKASVPCVTVEDRNGERVSVIKSDIERINLFLDRIEIVNRSGESNDFSRSEVAKLLLNDSSSGVSETASGFRVWPTLTEDIVNISGNGLHTDYRLYDLNGNILASGVCGSEGMQLSLYRLSDGMYLLTLGHETYKIVKK